MITAGIAYIQAIIQSYGVWGVFAATMIEEIIAPIPSALVPLAGGFFLLPATASLAEAAFMALVLVALPVAIGIGVGSSLVYAIAHYGGKPVIDRFGKWLGVSWDDVMRMQNRFTKGRADEVVLLTLRLLPIIPGVALSAFCGAIRYSFPRFLIITVIGSFIRAFAFGLVGWKVGDVYLQYIDVIDAYEHYALYLIGILLVIGFFVYVLKPKKVH